MLQQKRPPANNQSGNILLYVLLGIVLIGMLVAALRRDDGLNNNIDAEAASVQANQILNYGNELSQAVKTLLDNGVSEADIRFAHPDADSGYGDITTNPQNQVFSSQGGNAKYRKPPANTNSGDPWNFYADYALYRVGTDKADLVAMVPFVTDAVCKAINTRLSLPYPLTQSDCSAMTYFTGTYPGSPIAISLTPPSGVAAITKPLPQACITCSGVGNLYATTLISR